eukprot:gene31646-39091_t
MRIMQEANKAAAKSNNSFESLNGNGASTSSSSSSASSAVTMRKQNSGIGGMQNFQSPYAQTDLYGNSENNNYVTQNDERQQQTQFLLAPINNQYFDQREKAVTEVEKTIGELGTLFTRLSTMIAAQGEMVERIDEDIESANDNANKAKTVLEGMLARVSSNTTMNLKIAGILALFMLFFIIFML